MTYKQKQHYELMLKKHRAMAFYIGDYLAGFCTFYICECTDRFIQADPWDVLEDDNNGVICYINQLWTTKQPIFGIRAFKKFKDFIHDNFPQVRKIVWRRYYRHLNITKQHTKELRHAEFYSPAFNG